jgi:predicted dinucleotide-binding enzyme
VGHRVVYLIRLIADAGYDRAALGGLDKARAVEDLTWLLFAAMKDGTPVFSASSSPCEL